jgi:FAD/FMN-containing dehydrogenase
VSIPAELASLDGTVFAAGTPGYDAIRRPVDVAYRHVRPRLVVRCRSVSDVVRVLTYATTTGERIALRGGGHCFAGRSSSDGIVLDLSGLDDISVADDGIATIGAGVRLGEMYAALHTQGRTLPAGCGPSVGIAGLTLGGGIGLLGRRHGLTCDRLVGVQVVLPDGSVVVCDDDHEPELFWALRGSGGGQFGVVTSLRFDTVVEPMTTRIEAHWSGPGVDEVVAAWQSWAPDVPDELTANLTLVSEAAAPVRATVFGAATLDEGATRYLLRGLADQTRTVTVDVRAGLPYSHLKCTFADPLDGSGRAQRTRSEFFAHSIADGTLASLLAEFGVGTTTGRRELAFTAMGGAYNRVAEDVTAFAHRGARFLLQHIAAVDDPWVEESWAIAHADGSGRVYPNFPDLALDDWAAAYHAGNYSRLAAIKRTYDPHRLLDFPQAV